MSSSGQAIARRLAALAGPMIGINVLTVLMLAVDSALCGRLPASEDALAANVVNAVLNYALVLGHFGAPSLGVRGSAIGTVIAQAVNLALLVAALRGGAVAELRPRLARALDRPLARELLRVGWPAAADLLVFNLGFLAVLGML